MEDTTLGFSKAIEFNHSFLTKTAPEPLREAFEAFRTSLSRVDSLMLAPIYISFFSGLFERMRCAGEVEVTKKIVMAGPDDNYDHSEELVSSVSEATNKIRTTYLRKWSNKRK